MPRRDGTGPMGQGAMTGRGFGYCTGANAPYYGYGCRRGFGRGYGASAMPFRPQKDELMSQKELLEHRLSVIDSQLQEMQEDK